MSATNTLNPAHLSSSVAQTASINEPPKAGDSPSRMPTLSRVVQKLKTPIPQSSASASRSSNASTLPQPVTRGRQQTASEQVDSGDLAGAVALRGNPSKRDVESKKNNARFFKALTNGQPGFMEMHVRSIIDSVAEKSATKSLVDSSFGTESPKQRALMKFILLEVAISDPEAYGLSEPQLDDLTKARNALYERHGEYIEQSKLALDLAEVAAPRMKIGLKHAIKAFQMLPDSKQQAGTSMAEFLKVVMASSNKNITQVLKGMRTHWVNLAKRDRGQYSADVAKYRQYILNVKINQIESALSIISGLDKISALCTRLLAGNAH